MKTWHFAWCGGWFAGWSCALASELVFWWQKGVQTNWLIVSVCLFTLALSIGLTLVAKEFARLDRSDRIEN